MTGIPLPVVKEALEALSSIDGIEMNPDWLAEDVFVLTESFPEEPEFMLAVTSVVRAFSHIVAGRVSSSQLEESLDGWSSYHFQHKVGQGNAADMRLVFKMDSGICKVMGFGHRAVPGDVYRRLAKDRL